MNRERSALPLSSSAALFITALCSREIQKLAQLDSAWITLASSTGCCVRLRRDAPDPSSAEEASCCCSRGRIVLPRTFNARLHPATRGGTGPSQFRAWVIA